MGDGDEERPEAVEWRSFGAPTGGRDAAVDVWLSHAPGDLIADRYLLVRKLDQGGMGVVWVAHHLGLDIHVALKLVRPEVESEDAAERLVREAQAAARLDHPAIVHILDVGRTVSGDPFLVMELLEGELLGDVLYREKRLPGVTAMRVVLPIAGALGAMHAKGILHRDIKPDNIFLAQDDAGRWQPKLIDFGLARLDPASRSPITRRGEIVGTPVYLSPERIWGEPADPRDDVWALCVALYEMVTGAIPYAGDHPMQLMAALRAGEPRSLASHGVTDPELWEILRRGFLRRDARWESVRALGEAIARELRRRGVTQDISGAGLRPSWIAEADLEEIPGRSPQAISLPRLPLPPPPSIDATLPYMSSPAPPRVASAVAALSEPPPAPAPSIAPTLAASEPPASVAPPRKAARPIAWLAVSVAALAAIGASVGLVLRGRSAPSDGAVGATTSATQVAPAAPPLATASAVAPAPTASASSSPRAVPRVRSAGTPPPAPGGTTRNPVQDLKDPFH